MHFICAAASEGEMDHADVQGIGVGVAIDGYSLDA
jgi:hypothetical protein